jgi:hypothetical protein
MKIEQFFGDLPFERLEKDLLRQPVSIEFVLVDNTPTQLENVEQRFIERYPSREVSLRKLRDFLALHYTPLLTTWNWSASGLQARPEVGLEDSLDGALGLFAINSRIISFQRTQVERTPRASLPVLKIMTEASLTLTVPLRHPVVDREGVLSMTILTNPLTNRKEYTIRLYNSAIIIALR